MKYIKISLGLIITMCLICSCGSKKTGNNETSSVQSESETSSEIYETIDEEEYNSIQSKPKENDPVNQFAYKTASALLKDSNKNENYSPVSVYCALAVAVMGNSNTGQDQGLDLLGAKSKDELKLLCNEIYTHYIKDEDRCPLKIANSVWLNKYLLGEDVSFNQDFENLVKDNYNTSLYAMDFRDSNTEKKMGEWISENTKGTISPDVGNLPESMFISIMNAVYFKDSWIEPLHIIPGTKEFQTEEGKVNATFMDYTAPYAYLTDGENYTKAGLDFSNGNKMVFILPNEGVKVSDLLKDEKTLEEISCKRPSTKCQISWVIPKFSFNGNYNVLSMIQSLDQQENFGKLWDYSSMINGQLPSETAISSIDQKSYIAVDENGVEASAVTILKGNATAVEKKKIKREMNLNRPFIYEIVDYKGKILFIGVCNDPTK